MIDIASWNAAIDAVVEHLRKSFFAPEVVIKIVEEMRKDEQPVPRE